MLVMEIVTAFELLWKVKFTDNFFLLRGNHECATWLERCIRSEINWAGESPAAVGTESHHSHSLHFYMSKREVYSVQE